MITTIPHRMRNILRLAVLWTRRAGVSRPKHNRIAIRLRAFTKLTRKLINRCSGQETLDDRRLQVDFDCPDEDEILYFDCDEDFTHQGEDEETNGGWEIDLKAEEFIAKFHEHLRLERQRSIERESQLSMERDETSF